MAKIVGGDGWQTSDGTVFSSQDAAQSHQDGLDGKGGGGGGGGGFFMIFYFIYLTIADITAPIFKRIGRLGGLGRILQSLLWGAAWGIYALCGCEVLRMFLHFSYYITPFAWMAGTLVAAIWFYLREWYVLQQMDDEDDYKNHKFSQNISIWMKTGVFPDYTHTTAMIYMQAAGLPTLVMLAQLLLPVFGLADFKELLFNTILQGHIYEVAIVIAIIPALRKYFQMTRGYAQAVEADIKAPLDALQRIGLVVTIALIAGTFGIRILYVNVIEPRANAITGKPMIIREDAPVYLFDEDSYTIKPVMGEIAEAVIPEGQSIRYTIIGTIKEGERITAKGEMLWIIDRSDEDESRHIFDIFIPIEYDGQAAMISRDNATAFSGNTVTAGHNGVPVYVNVILDGGWSTTEIIATLATGDVVDIALPKIKRGKYTKIILEDGTTGFVNLSDVKSRKQVLAGDITLTRGVLIDYDARGLLKRKIVGRNIIERPETGAVITVFTTTKNGNTLVRYNGRDGWVVTGDLMKATEHYAAKSQMTVTQSRTSKTVAFTLEQDEIVKLTGKDTTAWGSTWVELEREGVNGWVKKSKLKKVNASAAP